MNGGGSRGGAYGVTFDTLMKLNTIKSTDNKSNLLCYVYQLAHSKYPEVVDLDQSLSAVSAASRISLSQLGASLKNLNKDVNVITTMIKQLEMKAKSRMTKANKAVSAFGVAAAAVVGDAGSKAPPKKTENLVSAMGLYESFVKKVSELHFF